MFTLYLAQIGKKAKYGVYSTFDLWSAYHQVSIKPCNKLYMAFEAGDRLYQFHGILFGVTNAVAWFQRIVNEIIEKEQLKLTFAYIDNVRVCGQDLYEQAKNLTQFKIAVKNIQFDTKIKNL